MQLDLKTALKRRRMSAYALARLVGVHKTTILRLVHKKTEPLDSTAAAIEKALGYQRGTIRFRQAAPTREATA